MSGFLSTLTVFTDFSAMTISLWLAFYLFGKGYPNKIAMRAVVVFLSLALFFFGAYDSQDHPITGDAELRAIAIVCTLTAWYGLTYQLIATSATNRIQRYKNFVYFLGVISATLLLAQSNTFSISSANTIDVAHMQMGPTYLLYGVFLLASMGGVLYNLLVAGNRIGLQPQGRYFLIASLLAGLGAVYGAVALGFYQPLPRIFLDVLAFASVLFLGVAVARQQAFIDRRILLGDIPVSAITVLGMALVYGYIVEQARFESRIIAAVTVLAIVTHSLLSLARESLERLRLQREGTLRKRIHQLEGGTEKDFTYRLRVGLGLLCQTIQATGGFLALRTDSGFVVFVSRHVALKVNEQIPASLVTCEDLTQIAKAELPEITWIAPVYEGQTQVAAIGIGKPKSRLNYSSDDLELLSEVAGQIGTLVSLNNLRSDTSPTALTVESDSVASTTDEMMLTMASNPDQEMVKWVEEALRHLSDYVALGQSPLVARLNISGESHVERGKALSKKLTESIEALHPGGMRPAEPLPRAWYNYIVLHDAYVLSLPNREVMARLFVSEGTFHRTRRNAVRGLARLLLEVTPNAS